MFGLREVYCPGITNASYAYLENQNNFAVKYDPKVFEQPDGMLIHGFLQSYKYFHPHAEKQVKKTFRFPGNYSPLPPPPSPPLPSAP